MEPLTLVRSDANPPAQSFGQENDLSLRVRAIDPRLDLEAEILRLKAERNAVILSHYYQDGEIQDLADHVGDSLALAQAAAATDADVIVFCGVHFMAETAKILNPDKLVLLPDLDAGCSLADRCPIDEYSEWLQQYPGHTVINYINSSAAVKAVSDIIVTSSNAVSIVEQLPKDEKIVFGPDRHLGKWVEKQTGREMVLWPGFCIVHEQFSARKLATLRAAYPNASLIAHPECEEAVLDQADFIGSTLALLKYVQTHPEQTQFIVATEVGILHQMKQSRPDAEFICSPPNSGCNCASCPYMRLNTLEKLYLCLRDGRPEITMPEDVRVRALRPVQRMLDMSKGLTPVQQKGTEVTTAEASEGMHSSRWFNLSFGQQERSIQASPVHRPKDAAAQREEFIPSLLCSWFTPIPIMPTQITPLLGEAIETPITTLLKPLIGAHMPTAGGHHNAITEGKAIGCESVQIFTASPRQWRAPIIAPELADKFRQIVAESGITKTVAHDSYLINLAAEPGSEVLAKSRIAFQAEIERAETLGVNFLVSHPGAHGGAGEDVGIARLIESLDVIHALTPNAKVRTALETTAGQGTYLGGKFEQLTRIIQGVKNPERLAVCLDTCHIFAAGYDIRTPETYAETMHQFDKIIGLQWLQVIHANDSQKAFGSHADRHAHIGEGEIGLEAFRLLVNDPRIAGLPIIVETPESDTMHEVNVKRLRDLIGV